MSDSLDRVTKSQTLFLRGVRMLGHALKSNLLKWLAAKI